MTDWNYEGKEAFNEYTNFPHLTLEASDYIAKNLPDLHVIGINSPSIAINSNLSSNVENDVFETHRRLLLKNKLILEDLDLKYFQKSNDNAIEGTLFFAPLKILEGDGGPCRAIFILKDNKIYAPPYPTPPILHNRYIHTCLSLKQCTSITGKAYSINYKNNR